MHPHLAACAARQFHVFTTSQAVEAGFTYDEVAATLRRAEWRKVRRAVFVLTATWDAADDRLRHLIEVAAIQVSMGQPIAAGMWSAAVLHGLPLIRSVPDQPWLVANREHSRSVRGARLQAGTLHRWHTETVDGLLVTTVARTISDVARTTRRVEDGLVMLEHSLRERLVTEADMRRVIADCPTWRGISYVKRLVELANPLNESPGETLSFLRMRELDVPLPLSQVAVRVGGGSYRLDFLWRELGVVGEFDGRAKYQSARDVYAEKRREDALRAAGLSVARWGWEHVCNGPEPLAPILRRAFAVASPKAINWSELRAA